MTSLFATHMVKVRAAVDTQFGEEVLIIPRTEGNPYIVGGVDPGIDTYTLVGVANVGNTILRVAGTRYKAKQDAMITGGQSEITFNQDQFSLATPAPRSGWHVQLTGRENRPIFRVSFPRQGGGGRLHCSVELIDSNGNP